jgi:hypothetical protein
MKSLIFFLLFITGLTSAQTYKVEKLTGTVKILNSDDKLIQAKEGVTLPVNSILMVDENSSAKISGGGLDFILKGSSALPVSSIKQMTFDELLLALAMEDMISAPRKKENINGKSTAVYGNKENGVNDKIVLEGDFGTKRLNGAVQLAENGFKESSVITSKEIYRKYPETKRKVNYRIYFANILYEFGLYEEAYDEFSSIKELNLSEKEKEEIGEKISSLNKKLANN